MKRIDTSFEKSTMFVCICNQVTDTQIRQSVDEGVSSFDALSRELGVGTGCGKCKTCAKKILREAMQDNRARVQVAFVGDTATVLPAAV